MAETLAETVEVNVLRACVAEVSAPKAGNVHLAASFDDATWADFVASASAIAPVLARASELGVGAAVLESVRATQEVAGSNTNLGIILLLAPLCACSQVRDLRAGIEHVLNNLSDADADAVYEAIRLAGPGGLGDVHDGDVRSPTATSSDSMALIEAMQAASSRDDVALQYVTGFGKVFDVIAPALTVAVGQGMALDQAIVRMHLELIADGDSLIARKCGQVVADEAAAKAKAVCDAGWPGIDIVQTLFDSFDQWLREDGNERNPGTSADLITAGLYVAFQQGTIIWPVPWQGELVDWSCVV